MPRKKSKTPVKKQETKKDGSWKRIPQKAGRSTSSAAKVSWGRRLLQLMRFSGISVGVCLVLFALAFGGYFLYSTVTSPKSIAPGESLVDLEITSNGVLPDYWIEYRLKLDSQAGLMQFDLKELAARLEQCPQIRKAEVQRIFPNTLRVEVKERYPVLRMKVKDANGDARLFLVDSEGCVFENVRFPKSFVSSLPYLAGVELRQGEYGYKPLDCMEPLVSLMKTARETQPDIYKDWTVVHADQLIMARSFTEGYIRIQSRDVPEILFAPENYVRQLQNLEYILDNHEGASVRSISRINLSLLNQPTVEFARAIPRRRR